MLPSIYWLRIRNQLKPILTLSIVSHGQGSLVGQLLSDIDLLDFSHFELVNLIVTVNIPEDESFLEGYLDKVVVLRNPRPLGFGANHNQAFSAMKSNFFAVLNPDLRISQSFSEHISNAKNLNWGCMAPIVYSTEGKIEDSARRYPSVLRISKRVFFNQRDSDYVLPLNEKYLEVEWLAGMFLLFRSEIYRALQGFDDSFFMYLEDADICRRANRAGFPVLLNSNFSVVHDARRNSFKDSRHLVWHIRSMIRFIFRL